MNILTVVWQDYEARVNDEFVLRGNAALLKCLLPSYVSDVVHVEAWVSNDGRIHAADQSGNETINENFETYTTRRISWNRIRRAPQ